MFAWQTHASAALARKVGYCLLPALLGAGAALVLLFVASGPAGRAYAGTLNYPGACGSTIQACIDGASTGDTILISAGDYTESLTLSKAVSLTGALSSTTILHALPNTRVLTVTGAAVDSSVVISGLTFTGGLVTGTQSCPASCGGGILVTLITASPRLSNLIIRNNIAWVGGGLDDDSGSPLALSGVAVLSNTAQGSGGLAAGGNVIVNGGVFQNNQCTARATGHLAGCIGGGLTASGNLIVTNTQFLSNSSGYYGGGAYVNGDATVNGGLFQNNQCADANCGGGGLWAHGSLSLTSTLFLSNTNSYYGGGAHAEGNATVNGGLFQYNHGGGLVASGSVILTGTVFQNNTGGGLAGGTVTVVDALFQNNTAYEGGGLAANTSLTAINTQFLSNTSTGYGGGAFVLGGDATLNGDLFQNNSSSYGGGGGGLYAHGILTATNTQFLNNSSDYYGGGGAYVDGAATLDGDVFQNNSGYGGGGGLYAHGILTATDTQFLSNTTNGGGGGAFVFGGDATLNGDLFQNNSSGYSGGGGGLYALNILTMTNTVFLGNTAQQGAGLYHSSGDARLVNDLFAANEASGQGDALYLASPGTVVILHNTIASPTLGNGAAIVVVSGTVGITDTVIASDTTGISQTSGSVYQDYNLFFGDGTNTVGGVSAGAHSFTGDPLFVNPAGGPSGYHLSSGSMAVDAGTNAGVTTDFDGDPRPQGNGFDIGFDESPYTALANVGVTKYVNAAARQPGQTLTYTLVFSNAGPEVAPGVLLTDIVPAYLVAVSYTSSGAALMPVGLSHYAWQVANLAPGAGGVVTVTGVLSGGLHGSVFTNTATITTAYSDTNPANNTSAVSVTVANMAPAAAADVYIGAENTTLTVTAPGVLVNDSDGNNDVLTATLNAGPLTGTLGLHADGSFTYIPPLGYTGVVTFTYRANDGLADTNTAIVTITVKLVANLELVKSASTRLLAPGQRLTYTLAYSNAGPEVAPGVLLTDIVPANLIAVSYTSSGATLTPVGLTHYAWQVADLAPGAGGVVTVTGVLSGGLHGSVFTNTATITTAYSDTNPANNTSVISVTVANVAPVAANDAYTVTGTTTLMVTALGVLANDTDANGDPLTALPPNPPVTGLILAPTGAFTYTPPIGFAGVVTFTYQASDGLLLSPAVTVTITVNAFKLYLSLLRR